MDRGYLLEVVWREPHLIWCEGYVPSSTSIESWKAKILTRTSTDTFRQGEVSGNKDIDGIQRSVGDTVGNQFGKGGLGEEAGKIADKGLLSR